MNHIAKSLTVISVTSAVTAGALWGAPPADASESTMSSAIRSDESAPVISQKQLSEALVEARRLGFVRAEHRDVDGSTTTTIDLGHDFVFDIVSDGAPDSRLGAGSDGYGKYVSFNSFDQGAIISGATFGIGVGLCAISLGVFCVVAGAILTAATLALGNNAIRCGTKALRVYPFSGHKPRCA